MPIPSKLGRTDRDIAGLVGSITPYGRNADALVENAFFDPPAPSGAASLALSATEGSDTASSAVSLTASLILAATEGSDTFAASVGLAASMSLAAAEGSDTASAGVGLRINTALSANEGADVCASNVALLITAQMAAVEGADLAAAEVSVSAASASMALDASEGADSCAVALSADGEMHGGVSGYNLWAFPRTREQREAESIAAGPVTAPENTPGVTPEVAQGKGQLVPLFIDPSLFTNHEQPVTVNVVRESVSVQPSLNIEESVSSLDDDELAACALVILQARANSYRRLRTGSHLPFSRAA